MQSEQFIKIKQKAKNSKLISKIYNFLLYVFYHINSRLGTRFEYYFSFGKKINIEHPKTLNEKIIWLKFYDNNALKSKCADKYEVREYLEQKGLGSILNEYYICTNDEKDIDFNKLPDKFIIKCTNGSGNNMIIKKPISTEKEKEVRRKIKKFLKYNYGIIHYEPQYMTIKNRVVVEKLLEEEGKERPDTINIYCCNGKAAMVREIIRTEVYNDKSIYYYDKNAKIIRCNSYAEERDGYQHKAPDDFNKIINIADVLSKDFKYVRIDLFRVCGDIIFNEMTFTPGGGFDSLNDPVIKNTINENLILND